MYRTGQKRAIRAWHANTHIPPDCCRCLLRHTPTIYTHSTHRRVNASDRSFALSLSLSLSLSVTLSLYLSHSLTIAAHTGTHDTTHCRLETYLHPHLPTRPPPSLCSIVFRVFFCLETRSGQILSSFSISPSLSPSLNLLRPSPLRPLFTMCSVIALFTRNHITSPLTYPSSSAFALLVLPIALSLCSSLSL